MAKTHDMWDTWPFDLVNLDYQLTVPMFRADDAVTNVSKHLIQQFRLRQVHLLEFFTN